MSVPEDEQGQRWLSDYSALYAGFTVDTPAMGSFAAALRNNVDADYVPHARKVFADMTAPTGPANAGFVELYSALTANQRTSQVTTDNLANHGNGASVFADAVGQISRAYERTDAYSAAQVRDVQRGLGLGAA